MWQPEHGRRIVSAVGALVWADDCASCGTTFLPEMDDHNVCRSCDPGRPKPVPAVRRARARRATLNERWEAEQRVVEAKRHQARTVPRGAAIPYTEQYIAFLCDFEEVG